MKFLLVFFNLIFWLCGLALIVVGIMAQVALNKTLKITDPTASAAPIVIIAVGAVIFVIAFFGCCGAWKESSCMVTMFAILLILVIIVEIAAVIAGYVFRKKVSIVVEKTLVDMMAGYNNNTELKKAVDKLQEDVQCCGVNSTSDWANFKPNKNSVPDSCCVNVTKDCGLNNMKNPVKVHQLGCQPAVEALLRKQIQWVIIAALVIAFLEVVGIVFACMLIRGIRSGYTVM